MKLTKPLVVFALACVTAFFIDLSFAQTTDVQAKSSRLKAKIITQVLRAEGYVVHRRGTSVDVETGHGVLGLKIPKSRKASEMGETAATLDGMELGPYAKATGLIDLQNLRQCLSSTDFIYNTKLKLCETNLTDLGDLLCKTGATFEWALNTLSCVVQFQQSSGAE